jgi:hypothetical protein
MEWISVKDRLPDCWSQHGSSYGSGYLLTCDSCGEIEIGQYWKHGKHTSKGFELEKECWEGYSKHDVEGGIYVTHWMPLPKKP